MRRYVSTLKLDVEVAAELAAAGHVYVEDLRPDDEILLRHGVDLARLLRPKPFRTALGALYDETASGHVPTLCRDLDALVGGVVRTRRCVEFCGLPGAGKTQMCLQLCVNVRVPKGAGGVGGRALYVATTDGFTTKRLREMSEHCVGLVREFVEARDGAAELVSDFTADRIMGGVYYASARTCDRLSETVARLGRFLTDVRNVRLIAIDSIGAPFAARGDRLDRVERLYSMLATLQRLADEFDVAIVVTNGMTRRYGLDEIEPDDYLVPCLGDAYAHRVNSRILLSRVGGAGRVFVAKTIKNPSGPVRSVEFVVDRRGVRPA